MEKSEAKDLLIICAKERDRLTLENEALRGLLKVAECPEKCLGGAYHGLDGEPVQCQFCYEREQFLSNKEDKS